MFGQGGEDQNAGPFARDMDAVGEELLQGGGPNSRTPDRARRDPTQHRRNARQHEDEGEEKGLDQA